MSTESRDVPGERAAPVAGSPTIADAQMRGLRWLAESLLPEGDPGLRDLPAPSSLRIQLRRSPRVRDDVLRFARQPGAGGIFEVRTRWLRWLPSALLVRALAALAYDGFIYARGESMIGHVFYQRHGHTLHAFSAAVSEAFEGHGYSRVMLLDFVAYAAQRRGIVAARVGRGRNDLARGVLERVKEHGNQLGWRVEADGWVRF